MSGPSRNARGQASFPSLADIRSSLSPLSPSPSPSTSILSSTSTTAVAASLPGPNHFLSQFSSVPTLSLSLSHTPTQGPGSRLEHSGLHPASGPGFDLGTLASHDFDVDVRSGFLPPQPPVRRLVGGEWERWEEMLDQAREVYKVGRRNVMGGNEGEEREEVEGEERERREREWIGEWEGWRERIREMDVISLPAPATIPILRRTHLVLAFLSHFYIHSSRVSPHASGSEYLRSPTAASSSTPPKDLPIRLPRSLAIPFYQASLALDIPPVLTYATTVLWNWAPTSTPSSTSPTSAELDVSLDTLCTFTSTPSESHFFLTSVLIERCGAPLLRLMSSSLNEAFLADELAITRISRNLHALARGIQRLTGLMKGVREGCDPRTFYWECRPWFSGGRWEFEGVPGREGDGEEHVGTAMEGLVGGVSQDGWMVSECGGPSAGQSTLIHALDLFLGVDHDPRPGEGNANGRDQSSEEVEAAAKAKGEREKTFMKMMSLYMPHHHRSFLTHLSNTAEPSPRSPATPTPFSPDFDDATTSTSARAPPPIRALALSLPPSSPLRTAYDDATSALKQFRESHMGIAYTYIVAQAKKGEQEGRGIGLFGGMVGKGGTGQGGETKEVVGSSGKGERENASQEKSEEKGGELKGTGGTNLVAFLKRCRERTSQALLDSPSSSLSTGSRRTDG